MLTVFARKEPTKDPLDEAYGMGHRKDVVIYRDEACTQQFARCPWHYTGVPRRNSKCVRLNCIRWALQWLPDEEVQSTQFA